MKKVVFCWGIMVVFMGLSATKLVAQDVGFSNKWIEKYHNGRNQLKSASLSPVDKFWLTPLLMEAKHNWSLLSDEAKKIYSETVERPKFKGTEKVTTKANFAFHYSTDGPEGESVATADLDNNGIPDYVDTVAHVLGDSINSLYHKTVKLASPPNDENQTNGAYYDIYINGDEAGDGTYGYVSPEKTIGDNPNTAQLVEENSSSSFMVIRNNYKDFGASELKSISVTAAHEYMHAIQFGYDENMDSWFDEAVATWAEDFAFPGYDDNFQYLSSVFSSTDVALNYTDAEDPDNTGNDGHWYGSWLFVKYLTEQTSTSIIKNIYEGCVSKNSILATGQVLKDSWKSDFEKMFTQYVIANSLLGADHKVSPYTYLRASDYVKQITSENLMKYEGKFEFTGTQIDFNSQTEGNGVLMRLSYENFRMTSTSNFKIEFTPSGTANKVDVILIKYSAKNGTSIQSPIYAGNISSIEVNDNSKWDYYIPVVVRLDADVKDIAPANYTLGIKKGNVTSVNDYLSTGNIYPNPATDKILVNINGLDLELVNVKLIDLAGKEVLNEQIKNNSFVDVAKVLAGIYVLRISNEHGEILNIKQIIK